ncbi:MAG: hypothetical protein NkDv07_0069 [Candidatus Improbicoccus devescovinae]|nr:MAG: hypothetical protein NkDv07_0069 [Candidatus Improbicoccus devescovinae]
MKIIKIILLFLCVCNLNLKSTFVIFAQTLDKRSIFLQQQKIRDKYLHGKISQKYKKIIPIFGYNSLKNPLLQDIYNEILKTAEYIPDFKNINNNYTNEININIGTTTDQITQILRAFENDHPEIFWLSKHYQIISSNSYKKLRIFSEYSPTEIYKFKKEINQALDSFLNDIPEKLTEYQRELWIHDKFINSCKYNIRTYSQKLTTDSNIYGALVLKKCVCEGYAKAMKLLLNSVGINSEIIIGYSKSELHAWNAVKIDGKFYHLDSTWDSNINNKLRNHDYFNLDNSTILKDHAIMSFDCVNDNLNLKTFTSSKYNYFNVEAVKFSSWKIFENNIIKKLNNIASSHDECIHILFKNNKEIENFLKNMSNFIYFILETFNSNSEIKFDIHKSISYNISLNQNVLSIKLSYYRRQ